MTSRSREEVLNVELARLLAQRGLISAPELIAGSSGVTRLPDVVVNFRGLRVVLEGKTDDVADAANVVSGQAASRVDEGLAHIAIAVIYPTALRTTPFADLPGAMARSGLHVQVHTEQGHGSWVRVADVDALVEILVRTYEQLVTENVVAQAVDIVEAGILVFERELRGHPALMERLRLVMEVGEPAEDASESANNA